MLYDYGLRSIIPVWNEQNKFGSGIRGDGGLTELGRRLIIKAVELGIILDLSHANKRTFNDILDVLEEQKKYNRDFIVIASHSNVRALCDRDRNLDDEQLERLKNIGGYIGLFANGNFLSKDNKNLSHSERQKVFVKHMDYVLNKIGFSEDRIFVSTDDMNFHPDDSYHNLEAFPIETIARDANYIISQSFGEEFARKVLIDNPKGVIDRVREKQDVYRRIRRFK